MTFEELVTRHAIDADLPASQAKANIKLLFAAIRSHVIAGGKVGIPQFGVFYRQRYEGGLRKINGYEIMTQTTERVRFRAAKGAKRRAR